MKSQATSLDYWYYVRRMLEDTKKYVVLIVDDEDEAIRVYAMALNQTAPVAVRPGRILEYGTGAALEICLRDVLNKRKDH